MPLVGYGSISMMVKTQTSGSEDSGSKSRSTPYWLWELTELERIAASQTSRFIIGLWFLFNA